jgi:hypothetical protein
VRGQLIARVRKLAGVHQGAAGVHVQLVEVRERSDGEEKSGGTQSGIPCETDQGSMLRARFSAIFGDFLQFSAKKLALFSKTNVMIKITHCFNL